MVGCTASVRQEKGRGVGKMIHCIDRQQCFNNSRASREDTSAMSEE